jgi:protein involved in polysaccharide export with SLBB domain
LSGFFAQVAVPVSRSLFLAVLGVTLVGTFSVATSVSAQVPIPLQEQVQIFNSLSSAEQQALIRELQSQLPPAQRDAVIGMLAGQQGGAAVPAAPAAPGADIDALADGIAASQTLDPSQVALSAGDTLVIDFALADPDGADDEASEAFLERLEDGNPYQLDGSGRILLPGVPAIALSGLNVGQATTRLSAERALRPFSLSLTYLPLTPVGTAALEPFGYELFRNAPSTFAPATDIPVPVDYVIGPGDTVNVQLFGNQNAEYFLTVSRDGTINFPEIGPLTVAGLSFDDVRNLINERVGEQMIGVNASTTLGELRSINVLLLGDVVRPGSYTVSSLATMTNALFAGGGIADIGSLRRIELKRDGETVATLDLYDLLLSGDTSADERLRQNDAIFVPPVGATVAVDGEVRRPAIYELDGEATIGDLIELAGGLRANANRSAVKLERIVPGRGIAVSDIDFLGAAGASASVQDGDVLRVEPNLDQLEGTVRLAGNVQREGLYQWSPGMTVSDLLPGPELVRPLSDLNYVLIRRETQANVDIDVLSVDLEAVWEGRPGAADLLLESLVMVFVFHLETGRQQFIGPLVEELEAQAGPDELRPVVTVAGQIRDSGSYPLEPGMRVSDLLRAGGGLADGAYVEEAELTRYLVIDGERRVTDLVDVDLAGLLAGDSSADPVLSPYDYLSIRSISSWGEQEAVRLTGEFLFPGTYPIRRGETLTSVLERAGGLTSFAFPEGSVFTRVAAREAEQAQLDRLATRLESELASMALSEQGTTNAVSSGQGLLEQLRGTQAVGRTVIRLDEIIAGRAGIDIELQDGDELIVPGRRQEVTVIGEVQNPESHLFDPGLSRDDYIERSGGLTALADDRRVYIVRANGEVVIDSGGRWFRRDVGIDMRAGDTIVAPLEIERMRPLELWSSVTQILYNVAVAVAAVNSF